MAGRAVAVVGAHAAKNGTCVAGSVTFDSGAGSECAIIAPEIGVAERDVRIAERCAPMIDRVVGVVGSRIRMSEPMTPMCGAKDRVIDANN